MSIGDPTCFHAYTNIHTQILARAGITQSNPLAALGNILKRGSGLRGSGRSKSSPKPSKNSPTDSPTPKPKVKPKKQKTPTSSPSLGRSSIEPTHSPPKSPKAFRFLRRSSSKKKGNGSLEPEDRSETSSISSLNIHSVVREEEEPMETEPSPQPLTFVKKSPVEENSARDTSQNTTARSPSPLNVSSTSSGSKRDSAYFKTPQVESLFGSDSALFGSSELEALFGKGKSRFGKEKTPERVLEPMEEDAKGRKEEESEKAKVKPGGSSVRARLQMYDKGETSKPLSASTPKVETTKPVKKTRLFESLGDEDLFGSQAKKESSPKPDEKPKTETAKKTEDLRSPKHDEKPMSETTKKARLFEDLGSPKHDEKPNSKKARLFEDLGSPKHDEKPKTETAKKAHLFEDLGSPKHDEKPKTETAKKARLFEDLGSPKHDEKPAKKTHLFESGDEDLFGSQAKKESSPKPDEKPKTETAKKARLFEDLGSPKHDEKPKTETAKKARLFEDLGSPKHDEKPKTETAKTARLFEDLGGDEDLFSSKKQRDEKPKTSTEKKKAHLFEDELFQDDLKPTQSKASPKRDVFGSPEREQASASPRRHGSTPPKDEPDFGVGVTAGLEHSSPTHPLFGESLDTTPAKEAEKPKPDDKKNARTSGILSYDQSPQFSARLMSERRRSKKQLDEFAESLFVDTEVRTVSTDKPPEVINKEEKLDKIAEDLFGEVPSARAKDNKTAEAMNESEEEELDKIAEDLFGEVSSAPAEETTAEAVTEEEELDKIAEALFGEEPVKEAGISAAKLSPVPLEVSEPTSDPLGAMTQKTEEKTRREDLFGSDAMDIEVPSDRGSKEQKSEKSATPDVTAVEVSSSPTPDSKVVAKEVAEKKAESEDTTSKVTSSGMGAKKDESKRTSRYTDSKVKSDSRVNSARSRFDSGNAKSTSPSVSRSRRTTAETVKSAAERKAKAPAKEEKKDAEGGKPSWMVELQKRKEGKKKDQEEKPKVAPAAKPASKEATIPEWQKRVMERRKKSTEEKSPLSSSRSDRLGKSTSSPKSSRVGLKSSNGATGTSSPTTGRKSPAVGRKSPSNGSLTADRKSPSVGRKSPSNSSLVAGRKSPRSANTTTTTSTETRTKSPIRSRYRDELGKSKSAEERAKSPEEKPALAKKPDISVDTTATKVSRKTSFTKIEISSRKVEKKSDSKEEEKKPSWSEDITPSKSPDLDHKEPSPNSQLESTDSPKEPELSKDSTIEVGARGKEAEVKGKKSETDDDVFLSSSEKTESSVSTVDREKEKRHSPSPLLSNALMSSVPDKDSCGSPDSQSRRDSVSSDNGNGQPYRSQSLTHSRSPTPTGPTGPVKLSRSSSSSVPEWKQRLLERKRAGTTASTITLKRSHSRTSSKPKEPEVPGWKKELLAKKAAKSTDAKVHQQ